MLQYIDRLMNQGIGEIGASFSAANDSFLFLFGVQTSTPSEWSDRLLIILCTEWDNPAKTTKTPLITDGLYIREIRVKLITGTCSTRQLLVGLAILQPCAAQPRMDLLTIHLWGSSTCAWTSTILQTSAFYAASRLHLAGLQSWYVMVTWGLCWFQLEADINVLTMFNNCSSCIWGYTPSHGKFAKTDDTDDHSPVNLGVPFKGARLSQRKPGHQGEEDDSSTWLYACTYELALCLTSFAWTPSGFGVPVCWRVRSTFWLYPP